MEANVRRHYNGHMADKEKAAQGGHRSAVEPVYIGISVKVTTRQAVDAVAEFLEENGDGGVVYRFKFGADHPRERVVSVVAAYVNIELIPSMAAIDYVERIKENHLAVPGGRNRQSGGGTVTDLLGVNDWHTAGVTSSGVEIAVLDSYFKGFRTRVVPFLSEPAKYPCYDAGTRVLAGAGAFYSDDSGHSMLCVCRCLPCLGYLHIEVSGAASLGEVDFGWSGWPVFFSVRS